MGIEDKIKSIEEEIQKTPYNKAAEGQRDRVFTLKSQETQQ